MVDIASLGVQVDASSSEIAAKQLDGLTAAGARAEVQAGRLSAATGATSAELAAHQAKVLTATMAQTGMTEAQARAALGYEKATEAAGKAGAAATDYQARLDKLTASIDPHVRAQQTMNTRRQEANELLAAGAITETQHIGLMQGITSNYEKATEASGHLRGGTASITREFLVLGREAANGNWTRMAGSLTLMAQYTGVLQALMNPLALGLIAVGAATVGFVVGVEAMKSKMDELDNIAKGVGASVGLTGAGIEGAAERGAAAADISVGAARRQAEAYAASGKVGEEVMTGLIGITQQYADATGQKAAPAVKELGKAFEDPAKGAAELNDKLHFLNDTQLRHIQQLADEGQRTQAQAELEKALSTSLDDSAIHVGGLTGAWRALGKAAEGAWEWMVKAGTYQDPNKGQPLGQQIENLQAQRARVLDENKVNGASLAGDLDKRIAALQAQEAQQNTAAANALSIDAGKVVDKVVPQANTLEKYKADLELVSSRVRELQNAHQTAGAEYQRLTDAQDRLTHATETWVTPAQRAHDIEKARDETAKAHTASAKGLAAQHMANAQAEGELITKAELTVKAQDAAAVAYDRKAAAAKRDPVADRLAALAAEADGNRGLADAYDLSTAAGFRAAAMAKALTDATKAHKPAVEDSATVQKLFNAELTAAVTKTEADAAKTVQATNAKTAAIAQANAIMVATGVSQQVANQMVADAIELRRLEAAAINVDADELRRLQTQIILTIASQADRNRVDLEASTIKTSSAADDELAKLQLEGRLIGASSRDRVIRLALLKEEQALSNAGAQPGTTPWAVGTINALANAKQTADNAAGQAAHNSELTKTSDLLGEILKQTQSTGAGLTEGFGHAGKAVADLTSALVTNAKALEDVAIKRKQVDAGTKDPLEYAKLDREAADIKVKSYGDTLEAAKGMFGKQTEAYKLLQDAETAYRVVQLAMQAKAIVGYFLEGEASIAKAGASVAGNQLETAGTVTAAGVEVPANTARGAAKMFASLGPWGFAAVGAMIAVMAALGWGGSGSSGSGSGLLGSQDGANDAKLRQGLQGAGTVLGDPTGKSDSIKASLDLVAKNTNADLEFSNQQLTTLRSIDTNIGTLTAALGRQLGIGSGGVFDTSKLGIGTSASSSLLGLLGSKTTTTLQDLGLTFSPQSLMDILAKGIQGSTYQQTATEKKSSFLGITYSDKTSVNTNTQGLDPAIEAEFTRVIASLEQGVLAAAGKIGVTGAKAVLDAFQVNLGTISLKDLKGADLTNALQAVFSKLGDQMATAVMGNLSQFQRAGEGAFQTLERLAKDYSTVDVTLQSIGQTFNMVGVDSIAARENLILLSGGIDNFTSQASSFVGAFMTEASQVAVIQKAVNDNMASLGQSGVTTKAQFLALVQGIDLTTAAGQQLYASLMAVAPAFAKVADYTFNLNKASSGIQQQILQLGDPTSIANTNAMVAQALALKRQDELAAMDASLRPLQLRLYALQDEQNATALATATLTNRNNLQIRLAQATNTGADQVAVLRLQRENELAATTDLATKAMLRQIYAAQDLATVTNTNNALQQRLYQATGLPADAIKATEIQRQQELLAATSDASRAMLQQIYAAQDLARVTQNQNALNVRMAQAQDAVTQASGLVAPSLALQAQRQQELAAAVDNATRAQLKQIYAETDLATAKQTLQQAYDAQVGLLKSTIASAKQLISSIQDYEDGLRAPFITLDQQASLAAQKFQTTLHDALAGDPNAEGQLTSRADAYLKLAQQGSSTSNQYMATVAAVTNGLDQVKNKTQGTLELATSQLDQLKQQTSGLVVVNSSLLTINQQLQVGFAKVTAALSTYYLAAAGVANGGPLPSAAGGPPIPADATRLADIAGGAAYKAANGDTFRQPMGQNAWVDDTYWTKMLAATGLFDNAGAYIGTPDMVAAMKAKIDAQNAAHQGMSGVPGFATGGSFKVGGSGGPDSQYIPLRLSPGEMVNVRHGGASNDNAAMADLQAEVRQLRQEMRASLEAIAVNTGVSARYNRRWDGDGLPPTRT